MPEVQVFVVGMNGSGTTMLADSLGKHPAIYMFPFETKVIPLYLARERGGLRLEDIAKRRALADEIGRTLPFWRANDRRALRVPAEVLSDAADVGRLFQAIFAHLAQRAGKRGWVEKSPGNVEHLQALARSFPQARFVHIIRDGRDAAQSFHRRWRFDPRHTIWRWKHCVRVGRLGGAGLKPERYMEVRYEDLTAEPERWMRQVCHFVGIPFDEAVLSSSMRHADATLVAGSATIVPNSGRWVTYFARDNVLALEKLAGRMLSELDYQVTIEGDEELSPMRRRLLHTKDAVMRSLAFFRDRGVRGLPMYLRRLRSALFTRSLRRF